MANQKQSACGRVDIGGQAVLEGVMMKAPDAIAISVRRPDGTIVTRRTPYEPLSKKHPWMGWPVIRGIVNFVTMLSMGMSVLQQSTDMLGMLDEEPSKFEKWLSKKLGKGIDKIVMAVAIVLAVILSIGLFFVIPELFARLLKAWMPSPSVNWLINLLSGICASSSSSATSSSAPACPTCAAPSSTTGPSTRPSTATSTACPSPPKTRSSSARSTRAAEPASF